MKESYFKSFIDYTTQLINSVQKGDGLSFQKEAEIYYYERLLQIAKQFYKFEVARLSELRKENEQLKNKKCDKIKTAHEIISEAIAEKVNNSVRSNLSKYTRTAIRREILEALKWKLQVRYADNLKEEHIEIAREFIQNYKIDNFYIEEGENTNEKEKTKKASKCNVIHSSVAECGQAL